MRIDGGFQAELARAQSGDPRAAERVLCEFMPLIQKYRYIGSRPDDDLHGELLLAAFLCVTRFRVDAEDLRAFLAEVQNGDREYGGRAEHGT